MNCFKILVFLFLLIELPTYSFSQSSGVSCSFTSDTLAIDYGQTFSNKLRFENRSSQAITLVQSTTTADVLLKLPDTVVVKPGEVLAFPVKYFGSAALLASGSDKINVSYTNLSNGEKTSASFAIKVNQANKLILSLPDPIVYLNTVTGLAHFKLYCSNRGYSKVTGRLKFTINPTGLQLVNSLSDFSIDAATDQVFEFDAKVLSNNLNFATNYNVTVECIDEHGNSLSIATLQIAEIGSNKREQAVSAGQYFNQLSNTAEVSYTTINKSYSFYSLLANGNIATNSDDHLAYNLNLNYYDKQHAFDAFDTWASYRTKHFGITAGNLMENLDYSLFGRGVKTSLFLNSHNSFDLYYVRNSYVLFSQLINQYPGASVFAGSYNFAYGGNAAKVSLLYSHNPLTGIDTRFTNGNAHIRLGANQKLDIRAGYSNEQLPTTGESHSGVAAGFLYNFRTGKWEIGLNNYYSSPYYSGLQRGTTQLDNLISFHATAHTAIFGRYELIKNSPKYMVDTLTIPGFYNNTLRYEAGLNFNYRSVNLTLHPYWFRQDINQTFSNPYFQVSSPLSSTAIRTGLDINYAIGNGQQISAITDVGYTKSDNPDLLHQKYWGVRVNANYFNKWWGMSVLAQNAPYYLSEEIAASYSGNANRYYNYSFGPNIHLSGLDNRLNISANEYLNFISYNVKRNNALSAQANYRFKKGWQISGQVFYNSYPNYVNSYSLQTRVGISKQFVRTTTPGTNTLDLKFYEDRNNNGVFDNGDAPIEGLIVSILPETSTNNADLTTITNKNGGVNYANLPKNNYAVSIVRGNGWHLSETVKVNLAHNQKLAIAMVKSGWLKGNVVPAKQEYVTTKPNLEGLKVIAVDDKNQTFSTLTNEFGEFEFALPVNNYRITLDVDHQKYSVSNPNQQLYVRQEANKEISFNLIDEAHKVIVKQF
ncbi:SdrD B-like domain-containing protein [Mucilaginibacter agri]|uniref:SD-repeat containing protein B domain-containing protein n=1 Tax=Mucilaginibacter agri TaxID=2695265 RepID=A0A966DXC2_9SPHI|nr:SdrD B-like domain-containing protein [Mucilaginibacter agri]NCD72144.1 hypothetical protein [Mucilaginibacter agri]